MDYHIQIYVQSVVANNGHRPISKNILYGIFLHRGGEGRWQHSLLLIFFFFFQDGGQRHKPRVRFIVRFPTRDERSVWPEFNTIVNDNSDGKMYRYEWGGKKKKKTQQKTYQKSLPQRPIHSVWIFSRRTVMIMRACQRRRRGLGDRNSLICRRAEHNNKTI